MQVATILPRPVHPKEVLFSAGHDPLGTDPSVGGLPEHIHSRTGGNPFFIEDVMQGLIEAGSLEGDRGAYRLEDSRVEISKNPANRRKLFRPRCGCEPCQI